MPKDGVISISHKDILRIEEITRFVRIAAKEGIKTVRLTGGEPLVRKGIVDLVHEISEIPGIENIAMTTNGALLPKYAKDLKEAGLSRVNISLDSLDPEKFNMVTRCGKLQDVFDGIDAAFEVGFDPIKINVVAIRGLEQNFFEFAAMSVDKPLHVRFIEYMPVGHSAGLEGCGWGAEDVISAEEIIEKINATADENSVPRILPLSDMFKPEGAGPARYYSFPAAEGTVGFISAMSNHFCKTCNRMRLTADGKLRPCLFSDLEFDIRKALRENTNDDEVVRKVLREALNNKPDAHHNQEGTARNMSQIGG